MAKTMELSDRRCIPFPNAMVSSICIREPMNKKMPGFSSEDEERERWKRSWEDRCHATAAESGKPLDRRMMRKTDHLQDI